MKASTMATTGAALFTISAFVVGAAFWAAGLEGDVAVLAAEIETIGATKADKELEAQRHLLVLNSYISRLVSELSEVKFQLSLDPGNAKIQKEFGRITTSLIAANADFDATVAESKGN